MHFFKHIQLEHYMYIVTVFFLNSDVSVNEIFVQIYMQVVKINFQTIYNNIVI